MYVSLQESLLSKSRAVASGNPEDIRSVVAGAIDKLIIPETIRNIVRILVIYRQKWKEIGYAYSKDQKIIT